MAENDHHFSINRHWDGSPLLPTEMTTSLRVERQEDGLLLEVKAPFYNDPAPTTPVGSTDGLWAYEVVEWFVVGEAGAEEELPYLEIELSPHGHYLALQLSGVRQRVKMWEPLRYEVTVAGNQWAGKAWIPYHWFPPQPTTHNAYAIHGVGEKRRYLAMTAVPGAQPDFHRLSFFTELPTTILPLSPKGGL